MLQLVLFKPPLCQPLVWVFPSELIFIFEVYPWHKLKKQQKTLYASSLLIEYEPVEVTLVLGLYYIHLVDLEYFSSLPHFPQFSWTCLWWVGKKASRYHPLYKRNLRSERSKVDLMRIRLFQYLREYFSNLFWYVPCYLVMIRVLTTCSVKMVIYSLWPEASPCSSFGRLTSPVSPLFGSLASTQNLLILYYWCLFLLRSD